MLRALRRVGRAALGDADQDGAFGVGLDVDELADCVP
jgi:hypothetical protein